MLTVREMKDFLESLPEEYQNKPVVVYDLGNQTCDEIAYVEAIRTPMLKLSVHININEV